MNTLWKFVAFFAGCYYIERALSISEKKVNAEVEKLRAERAILPDPWDVDQGKEREKEATRIAEEALLAARDSARALKDIRDSMGHEVTLDPESIIKLRDAILDAVTAPAKAPAAPVTRTDAEVAQVLTQAVQAAETVAQAIETPATAPALVPEVVKVES